MQRRLTNPDIAYLTVAAAGLLTTFASWEPLAWLGASAALFCLIGLAGRLRELDLPDRLLRLVPPFLVCLTVIWVMRDLITGGVPLARDHPVHFYKTWVLTHDLIPSGRLWGWTDRWYSGLPLNEVYPLLPYLWSAGAHWLSLGLIDLEQSYGLGQIALWLVLCLAAYGWGARLGGRWAGLAAALFLLFDPGAFRGGGREGGWIYLFQFGVWPQALGLALALTGGLAADRVLRGGGRRWVAIAAALAAAALLAHPLGLIPLVGLYAGLAACFWVESNGSIAGETPFWRKWPPPVPLHQRLFTKTKKTSSAVQPPPRSHEGGDDADERRRRGSGRRTAWVLGALGLGGVLSAFWYALFLGNRELLRNSGSTWRDLDDLGRSLVRGEVFLEGWAIPGVLALIGALVLARRRTAEDLTVLGLVLGSITLASPHFWGTLLGGRLPGLLGTIQYDRLTIHVKPLFFVMAGVGLVAAARAALASGRPDPAKDRRHQRQRALVTALICLLAGPLGLWVARTGTTFLPEVGQIPTIDDLPEARELDRLAGWLAQRADEADQPGRVALRHGSGGPRALEELFVVAARAGVSVHHLSGTPADPFTYRSYHDSPEELRALGVRYVVSRGPLTRDDLRLVETFGPWSVYRVIGFSGARVSLEGPGRLRILEQRDEEVRIELAGVSDDSVLVIHRTPHPRWRAEIDGDPVEIRALPRGRGATFMRLSHLRDGLLVLRYTTLTPGTVIGLLLSVLGLIGLGLLLAPARWLPERFLGLFQDAPGVPPVTATKAEEKTFIRRANRGEGGQATLGDPSETRESPPGSSRAPSRRGRRIAMVVAGVVVLAVGVIVTLARPEEPGRDLVAEIEAARFTAEPAPPCRTEGICRVPEVPPIRTLRPRSGRVAPCLRLTAPSAGRYELVYPPGRAGPRISGSWYWTSGPHDVIEVRPSPLRVSPPEAILRVGGEVHRLPSGRLGQWRDFAFSVAGGEAEIELELRSDSPGWIEACFRLEVER